MALELATPDELVYQFNPVSTGSLHFKVRAGNDAHIALTSGPEEADPMYEVFIGGWSNSKSVVRRNRTKPDVAEVETPGILSDSEFRGFWISWDNGTVSAGKEGEDTPFLTYSDPEPFGIGYYGVCTGWGASGTWLIEGGALEISTKDGGDCLSYTFYPIRQGSLEFDVRTPSNAHLALTTGPKETDSMYEIILGGWENTASVIRNGIQKVDKVKENTPNLLSQGEPRRFEIEWEDGRIQIQHKGQTIIEWTNPEPFGISYFGIRTGWGATGHWRLQAKDLRRKKRVDDSEEELKNGEAKEAEVEEEKESDEQAGDGNETNEEEAITGWIVPPNTGASGLDTRFNSAATTQPGWNIPSNAGASGPGTWVDAAGGEVPSGAVPGGFDQEQLYIARANHEGSVIPGKLVPSHGVAYVAWGGGEHGKPEYQVLCGCTPSWVGAKDGEIPPGALSAGQTEEGEQLYIGRVDMNGVMSLGKVQPSHSVCYIPYGGQELSYPDYEVLVSN